MNTLSAVITEVLESGQGRALTREETAAFHREFAEGISPQIDAMRSQQRKQAGECRHLVLD